MIRKRLNEPTQKGSKLDVLNFAKFEVLTTVFWNVTPCSLIDIFRRVRRTANSDYSLRRLSVCLSEWDKWAPDGRICMKFGYFSKTYRENSSFIQI